MRITISTLIIFSLMLVSISTAFAVETSGINRPQDPITRAELVARINEAFEIKVTAITSDEPSPFTDLKPHHWAYADLTAAYQAGYLNGDPQGRIAPDRPATRQEIAVMLMQLLELSTGDSNAVSTYKDAEQIAPWAAKAVAALTEREMMSVDQNGFFHPRAPMKRAEAFAIIKTAAKYRSTPMSAPQASDQLSRLKVSDNGRFLTTADGQPFFWLGDTAWELAGRLDRGEVRTYLQSAAEHGFTVVQFVLLTELDQLKQPNAYGDFALTSKNPETPSVTPGNNPHDPDEYDYWDHVDYVVDTAASFGLYVAVLPTWGSYLWVNVTQRADPIFTESSAESYGQWLGERYKDKEHLIWVLGGDRIPDSEDKKRLIRSMAKGIKSGGAHQLITYHPWGGKSSSDYFHDEEWLDFNSFQSGHPSKHYPNDQYAIRDYAKKPIKPTLDMEPRYEETPINFDIKNGKFNAYDTRQAAYWSVFAGAFGHTYGHNHIWQMYKEGKAPRGSATAYWSESLDAEGRITMKHLRTLIEARPMLSRVPDQTLVKDTLTEADRILATRGDDYAFIYSSSGKPFTVRLGRISGKTVTASWFNPRTGEASLIGEFANSGEQTFTPPTSGAGEDWVLILDDAAQAYTLPGH